MEAEGGVREGWYRALNARGKGEADAVEMRGVVEA